MKDKAAVALGKKRWRGKGKAERVAHMTMMAQAAAAAQKRKKKKPKKPPNPLDA